MTELVSVTDNKVLELNYSCRTTRVTYSIADLTGSIILKGLYNCEKPTRIPIEKLPRGFFILYIVDGGSLVRTHFQKD
ncbi:MAG: hypothetical protein JWP12_3091 [Bacteroidetes bacterium]|nr:hypothetical protein [Bacteroidota bacterium]